MDRGDNLKALFGKAVEHLAVTCGTPYALITLNAGRCWLAEPGCEGREVRPDELPAIFTGGLSVADERAQGAIEESNVGARLTSQVLLDGDCVGSICIADDRPRSWRPDEIAYLDRSAQLLSGIYEGQLLIAERDRRIELERDLVDISALHRAVVASMREGVVVQDARSDIITCNASACEILGLTEDQLRGRTSLDPRWRSIDTAGEDLPGDRHPAMLALASGRPEHSLFGVERPTGERRWIEVRAVPVLAAETGRPKMVVATFNDVTAREQRERQLLHARRAAEASSDAKSRFLESMSLEIRSPLNAIAAAAQALQTSLSDTPQLEGAASIGRTTRALAGLLDNVLDLSRIEAGRLDILPVDSDLAATLKRLVKSWRPSADEKGLELALALDRDLPERVRIDPERLSQCVSYLIANAFRLTCAGRIDVLVRSQATEDGWGLTIQVADTGAGIDAQSMGRMFQPFATGDETASSGAGLGLPIARRLAELMGGDVTAISTPGVGSIFTATFLAGRAAQAESDETLPAMPSRGGGFRAAR